MLQSLEQELNASTDKVVNWFTPIADTLRDGLQLGEVTGSIDSSISVIISLLNLVKTFANSLKLEIAESRVRELARIIEDDLNFGVDQINTFIENCVDGLIEALTLDFLNGVNTPESKNNYIIGRHIAEFKRFFFSNLTDADLPPFDFTSILDTVFEELREMGWDDYLVGVM